MEITIASGHNRHIGLGRTEEHQMNRASSEHFLEELKSVIESAEALLKATGDGANEQMSGVREHVEQKLRTTRDRLSKLERDVIDEAREKAQAADQFVSDNPWRSIGVVAGLAFVLGVILGRRK
jgi:ElaB/YqjD/DUF883 family membrane-anchored ribosome-binding protein